jgi:hypothetical protein
MVMNCDFEISDGFLECRNCERRLRYKGVVYVARCRKSLPVVRGLGDRLEQLLTKFGITEEKYRELKAIAGFSPTCQCPQRKDLLNELPTALITGFLKGGFGNAWKSAVECAERIKERYARPR